MRLNKIEVSISTIGPRIYNALNLATKLQHLFDVLIIHQTPDDNDYNIKQIIESYKFEDDHFRYFRFKEKGLTISRNRALQHARKEYLWFLDDDVEVDLIACRDFFGKNIISNADITTIASYRSPLKKYPLIPKKHNLLSILSVGTIEIIAKTSIFSDHNCSFPEDMGAGTNYPICEEPVFLSYCIKNGLKVQFQPAFIVSHHHESSGDDFLKHSHCRARGLAFSRIFGPYLGLILILPFYAKNIKRIINKSQIKDISHCIIHSLREIINNR